MAKNNKNKSQEEVSKLGVSSEGLTEEELKAKDSSDNENTQSESETEQKKDKKVAKAKNNTAIVYNGSREVRRFTLDTHGEDFEELANSFAAKNKYAVVLKSEKPAILCPHCGGKIYQKEA